MNRSRQKKYHPTLAKDHCKDVEWNKFYQDYIYSCVPPTKLLLLLASIIHVYFVLFLVRAALSKHSAGSLHTDAQRWNIAGALELELVKRRCADRLKGLRCLKALLATEPQSN